MHLSARIQLSVLCIFGRCASALEVIAGLRLPVTHDIVYLSQQDMDFFHQVFTIPIGDFFPHEGILVRLGFFKKLWDISKPRFGKAEALCIKKEGVHF